MGKLTDIRVVESRLYFLPVKMRVPLKFGTAAMTSVTCARAWVRVEDRRGHRSEGWGETPLSVQWVWPGATPYPEREEALREFCRRLAREWCAAGSWGHPMEVGYDFQEGPLRQLLAGFNQERSAAAREPMPWLAALVCCSLFDLAVHDAFGCLVERPVYDTYDADFMSRDLAGFLESAGDSRVTFQDRYPGDFLVAPRRQRLPAWHLVGGLDPLEEGELTGAEPRDGFPILLADWIRRDGLRCLKIKLRGNDWDWDYRRVVRVGDIGCRHGVEWLTADFNCTVTDPDYVNRMLDALEREHAGLHHRILYVEQPFPYELEKFRIDVRSVSARKPIFLDESAHDWRQVRLGRDLGWSGVALKTCKTQTGALLSLCWAEAHGMALMVQDLTNPMLAQIPHLLLAAHASTIMGVETNSMQFYPEASFAEAQVHPGIYQRRNGEVDLTSIQGPGFGYRIGEIHRVLPAPEA